MLDESAKDFKMLRELAGVFGFGDKLVFTNSLARGLDYYTGFIWEIKLDGVAATISAGGRYDGLLDGPCVGISIGISRLAAYMPPVASDWRDEYFVTTIGNVNILDKMRIINKLQTKGLKIRYALTSDDKKTWQNHWRMLSSMDSICRNNWGKRISCRKVYYPRS